MSVRCGLAIILRLYEIALSSRYCLSYTLGYAVNKTEKNACPYETAIPVGKRDSKSNEYLNHTVCEVIVPEGKRKEHQGEGRDHIDYMVRWGQCGVKAIPAPGPGSRPLVLHWRCSGPGDEP